MRSGKRRLARWLSVALRRVTEERLEPLALTAKSAGLGLLLATALLAIEREGLVLLRESPVLLRELLVSEMELPAFVKEKLVFVMALLVTVLVREFGRVGRKHR